MRVPKDSGSSQLLKVGLETVLVSFPCYDKIPEAEFL